MISVDDVVAEAQRNGRLYPQASKWQLLYDILLNRQLKGKGPEPPPPLILRAWWYTPGMSKMLQLCEQIEWADQHGCLDSVYSFLTRLSEEEWYHTGD